jgi:hypothetical protein
MPFYRWASNPIQLAGIVRNNLENQSLARFMQLLSFSTEGREKAISIPIEKLDFAYSRCSGPGMEYEYFHSVLREVLHAVESVKFSDKIFWLKDFCRFHSYCPFKYVVLFCRWAKRQ